MSARPMPGETAPSALEATARQGRRERGGRRLGLRL